MPPGALAAALADIELTDDDFHATLERLAAANVARQSYNAQFVLN